MPPITTPDGRATATSFLGLQSYTEAQSNSFFGRETETDTLTSLIELNSITIVFGRSGTGKTSLLNAGVFPKLRKSFCLPFRIRLEFNDNSPDLITQIKKVLKEEIDKYGFKVEAYPSAETLWEYFHKEPLWKTVTPILVFDQFEEIFTLAKANPRFASIELPVFWEELSNLIENTIPEKLREKFLEQKEKVSYNYKRQKAKVVFSFREEYLPEFESIAAKIPSLKYSRFRLLPMNGYQAHDVITKTWKANINAVEAKRLVSYFTNETGINDYSLITVEPSLLSQVCAYIDKERIESGGGKVSAELLDKYPQGAILRSIYDEAVTAANSSLDLSGKTEDNRNLMKEFVEEKLITTQGYRTKYHLTAQEEVLKPGLNILTARYLVREDDNVVELTHDVLAPIIKIDREKRRTDIAFAKEKKKVKRIVIGILFLSLVVAGIFWLTAFWQRKAEERKLEGLQNAVAAIDEEKKAKQSELDGILASIEGYKDDDPNRPRPTAPGNFQEDDTNLTATPPDGPHDSGDIESELTLIRNRERKLQEEIARLKDTIEEQKMRLRKYIFEQPSPPRNDSMTILRAGLDNANKEISSLKEKLRDLMLENSNLRIELLKKQKTIDSLKQILGDVSISGKLFYGKIQNSQVMPSNITMFLIPKDKNKRIVQNASVYEISCYEKELNAAVGRIKTVTDKNGNFAFHKVPPGRYLLKICTYYGGFYQVTVGADKKPTIMNFNASPPVPYPYAN